MAIIIQPIKSFREGFSRKDLLEHDESLRRKNYEE